MAIDMLAPIALGAPLNGEIRAWELLALLGTGTDPGGRPDLVPGRGLAKLDGAIGSRRHETAAEHSIPIVMQVEAPARDQAGLVEENCKLIGIEPGVCAIAGEPPDRRVEEATERRLSAVDKTYHVGMPAMGIAGR